MSRSKVTILAALALAVVLWAAVPTPAQHRGGGGHGGFHSAGVHSAGFHSAGFHPTSFHSASFHSVGFRPVGFHSVAVHPVTFKHVGFNSSFVRVGVGVGGFGFGGYGGYGGYGGFGGYGGYSYAPTYADSYYAPSLVVGSDAPTIVVAAAPATTTMQSRYYTPQQTNDNRARVHVIVPADAVLTFDGTPTMQKGPERDFTTPELNPDKTFFYEVKARWMQDGQAVERTLKVDVRANKTTLVDFTVLPAPKEKG
jgi:uncharacterized protein (TIGR03000 family)